MLNKNNNVKKLPTELEAIFRSDWSNININEIPKYTLLFKEVFAKNNIDANEIINFEEVINVSGMGSIYVNKKNESLFPLKTRLFEALVLYTVHSFHKDHEIWDTENGFAFLFIKSLCDNLDLDTGLPETYMGQGESDNISWFKYTTSQSKLFDALLSLNLKIETVEGQPNFLTNISIMNTENLLKIISIHEINPFVPIDKNDRMNAFAYLAMVLKSDIHSTKEKENTLRNLRVLYSFVHEDYLDKEVLDHSPYPKIKNLTYRQLYKEFAHDLLIPLEKKEINNSIDNLSHAKIKQNRI